jgi:hypothetical protein
MSLGAPKTEILQEEDYPEGFFKVAIPHGDVKEN